MKEILWEKETLPHKESQNVIMATLKNFNRLEEENHKIIELVDKIQKIDSDWSMVFDFSPFYTDGPVIKLSAWFIKTLKENGSIFSKEDVDNFRSIFRSFHKVLEDNGLSSVNDYNIANILGFSLDLRKNDKEYESFLSMKSKPSFHSPEDLWDKTTLFLSK